MENSRTSFLNFFLDLAKILLISLLIIVPIRYFIAQPFFVRGASMEPSYDNGDYLIVDQISYRFNDPHRGDVIIFRYPENPAQFFIKRIIGLPGETIIIRNGEVTIINSENTEGLVLEEDYLNVLTGGNTETYLAEDEYFVLGDNRQASHDSRKWGALQEDFVIGKVFLRAWPFNKFGRTMEPAY